MKLAKQPFDPAKCEIYRKLAMEAQKKAESDIVDALKNYNTTCSLRSLNELKGISKQKGMEDAR
jgi:hypothetical protein